MEPAEKATALEHRIFWTQKHWTPFFSDMPPRILSSGSIRCPSAVIARPAENSATFSAHEVSALKKIVDCENIQELKSVNDDTALLAIVEKR
jgi:hypothetical protein